MKTGPEGPRTIENGPRGPVLASFLAETKGFEPLMEF